MYIALLTRRMFLLFCLLHRYSKSLCYQCLPFIFDGLRTDGLQSIILFISPLVAIIKDQARKHPSRGNHGSHMQLIYIYINIQFLKTCKVLE